MVRPRDNQRKRVYDMERYTFFDGQHQHVERELSLRECGDLIAKVLKGKPLPQLRDGRGCNHGFANSKAITLPPYARRDWYVLHELSHVLVVRYYGNNHEWHGAHFMRVYIEIVRKYTPQHTRLTVAHAKFHRVKVAPATWYKAAREQGL